MGSYHKRPLLLLLFWVADGDSSTFRQEAKALHRRGGVMLCSWQYRTCRCWWPQGILFPFPLSSRCGFLECRPLAGEYPAKRLCVVRPALGAYISGTRLVRRTYSLAGCSCTSYSPPSRGMGFHKLSIVYFLRLSICPCSIDIVSHHIMS